MDKKLDNFESFIKNSMDNHEASYSGDAWNSTQEAMNSNPNGADGFESFVKKSLDNHEAPYAPGAWKSFALLLGKTAVPFYKTKGFIAAISAVVIAGVVILSLPKETEELNEVVSNDVVKEKTVFNDTKVNEKNTSTNNNTKAVVAKEDEVNTLNNGVAERDGITVDKSDVVPTDANKEELIKPINAVAQNDLKEEENTQVNPVTVIPATVNVSANQTTQPKKNILVGFELKPSACSGESIVLAPREINNELSYKWLLNDKVISNEATVKVALSKLGENNIDLIAYLKGERVSSRAKTIHVMDKPKADIVYQEDKLSLVNSHSFKTNSEAKTVAWNFGDGETSNELKASHSYKKQGKYTLNYSITNNAGCEASYSKDIIVKGHYNIRTDHGFSPDGDGSLDMFLPEELKLINQPFEMVVYSRSQEIVYKTTNINNPWNGRDLEGNMVPFGVYVWVINMTNEYGESEVYKGSVTKASN